MDDIREAIIEVVAKIKSRDPSEIDSSKPLQEIGFKSVDRMAISVVVKKKFQIALSTAELMKPCTIDDFVELVKQKQGK